MIKRLAVFVLLGAVSTLWIQGASAAPTVTVGVEGWSSQIHGNVNKPTFAKITFNQLDMGRHWNPNFIIAVSTPAYWPDIRVEYGLMQSNGEANYVSPVCFLGYNLWGNVRSQAALKQGRILLAWHPIHNELVDFQTGLDIRWITLNLPASADFGTTACDSTGTTGNPPSDATSDYHTSAGVVSWLPEANLGVTVHLPANFDIFFRGSAAPYRSNYIYDFRAALKYNFASGVSIVTGYRRWRLHLGDENLSVMGDMDFKGPFAGIFWTF